MREILFRGFHPDENGTEKVLVNGEWINGFWVYGYFTRFNGEEYRIYNGYAETDCGDYFPDWYSVIPETVGQYTGLKDKNGKRIFENDIVKNYLFGQVNGIVKFGKYNMFDRFDDCPIWHFGIYLNHIDNSDIGLDINVMRSDILLYEDDLKVIGSVHSNPELLDA